MSTPVLVRRGAELVFENLPTKPYERLRQTLTVPNPAYANKKRWGGRGIGDGDPGTEPRFLEPVVQMPSGHVHVPRGALDAALDTVQPDDLAFAFRDECSYGTPLRVPVGALEIPLHDYQEEAVAAIGRHRQGLVVLPPGTGKTRVAVAAIARLGCTALVVVPTIDIADQWIATLAKAGFEPGLVGDGRDERFFPIVVGLDDSVDRLLAKDPGWGRRFGQVFVDEAHRAASRTYLRLLRALPAAVRIGLTATPDREDGLSPLLGWTFGAELIRCSTRDMIRLGHLQAATVEAVPTHWTWSYTGAPKKEIAAMEKELAEDLGRNALIAQRTAAHAQRGEACLVLCGRRTHTRELADHLGSAHGVAAVALTSASGRKARKAAVADLRAGTLPVVCATSLADEGLDVPNLAYIALAAPQRARSATMQRLGRLLRLWEGKKPHLDDFVDEAVPMLVKRARARRAVFQEAGVWNPTEGRG